MLGIPDMLIFTLFAIVGYIRHPNFLSIFAETFKKKATLLPEFGSFFSKILKVCNMMRKNIQISNFLLHNHQFEYFLQGKI